MNVFLNDDAAVWAIVLVVILPILIIGAGEVQERLRQRGSGFETTVATLRNWVLPLLTLWLLVVAIFEVATTNFFVRVLGTVTLFAGAAATLQAINYLVARARARSERPGARGVPQLVFLLPRLVVFLVVAWLVVGSVWNVDISGLFAALGVTSLVISLALQPTLSGIASGLLLLGDRPFNPGDWIKTGDLEGLVLDLGWRTSKVQNRNGDIVIIPNSQLSDATLFNFAQPTRLHRVVVPVQVAYANPPTVAKEMLLAAARATPGVLEDPAPTIRVVQIDDPLMGYEADLWIDDYAIAPRVFSDFGSLVWYQSHRMGVPLPSPAFDLFHHDPIQEAADAEITEVDIAAELRIVPLLTELDDAEIGRLAEGARQVRFRAGETIVASGSRDATTYVLVEGSARIVSVDRPLQFVELGRGDLFGMIGQWTANRVPPVTTATSDCEVIVIDAEVAGQVASRNPVLTDTLNKLAANRRRRLEEQATPGESAHFAAIPEREPSAEDRP
jgi:small-conductance mechanosensitive channel